MVCICNYVYGAVFVSPPVTLDICSLVYCSIAIDDKALVQRTVKSRRWIGTQTCNANNLQCVGGEVPLHIYVCVGVCRIFGMEIEFPFCG